MLSYIIAIVGVYIYGYVEHCRACDKKYDEDWELDHESHHCSSRGDRNE